MNNIVLIGMPGTGKTVVGRALAEQLNFTFVDLDDIIAEKAGKRLPEILREDGLEAFLALEEQVGLEQDRTHTVIATGGSMVYHADAMEKLKDDGIVIYLEISFKNMMRRIRNFKTRGVVLKENQTPMKI